MHYSTKALTCQLKLDNITSVHVCTCKYNQYSCIFLTSYMKSTFFHIYANIDSHYTVQNWLCFFGDWGRALLYSHKTTLAVACSLSFTQMLKPSEKKRRKGLV